MTVTKLVALGGLFYLGRWARNIYVLFAAEQKYIKAQIARSTDTLVSEIYNHQG